MYKSTFIFAENGKTEVGEKPKAKPEKTLLERWEESLMSSTNLAQVFIHLSSLDNCVSWNKSVLNARCKICRRKGDAEHMLLCDGCDRGHHMYCLKPPIKQVRRHITLLYERQEFTHCSCTWHASPGLRYVATTQLRAKIWWNMGTRFPENV